MNRRALLTAMGWFISAGGSARAAIRPPPSVSRRLKLYNVHTKETFDGPYRGPDGVIDSAAAELSEFLRDFHSGVVATIDIAVIDFLWDALNAVGATDATILSAYRTSETNAMLARTTFGVAEHSQHMYARAIDFTIGSRLEEAMAAARAMKRGGVGWYPNSGFIHIDSGPVRNWDLDDTGLGRLLFDGRAIHFNDKGELVITAGHGHGAPLMVGGGRPPTVQQRMARLHQLARAEFLARRGH